MIKVLIAGADGLRIAGALVTSVGIAVLAHLLPHRAELLARLALLHAALLDLPLPEAPWHGHGDRVAEVSRQKLLGKALL